MKQIKTNTRGLALLLSLLLVLGVFGGCNSAREPSPQEDSAPASSQAVSQSSNAGSTEAKSFAFKVVHKDGSGRIIQIHTEADNLRAALEQEGLIEGEESEYGLYVKTVDGETVDDSKEEWWCLTDKDGNMTPTGVDDTKISDGDFYTFTFTVGYDS